MSGHGARKEREEPALLVEERSVENWEISYIEIRVGISMRRRLVRPTHHLALTTSPHSHETVATLAYCMYTFSLSGVCVEMHGVRGDACVFSPAWKAERERKRGMIAGVCMHTSRLFSRRGDKSGS